jgi:archaellum component FlaG (FlaF/FlaG flagellin family)
MEAVVEVEDDKVEFPTLVLFEIGDDSCFAAVEEVVVLVGGESEIKALISFIGDDGSEFKDVMVNELILKENTIVIKLKNIKFEQKQSLSCSFLIENTKITKN